MPKKKKIELRNHERVLLTETLPYELPIFFSNAGLCILAHKARHEPAAELGYHKRLLLRPDGGKVSQTRPLSFEIRKNATATRRLSIPHPKSQHAFVDFYEQYDLFITQACNRSLISLRCPSRVGTFYFHRRFAEVGEEPSAQTTDEDPAGFRNQRKWASSYFSYRTNQSYKFFESPEFLELEQRYNYLRKLDISRCFDSIYTHSISWALRGKEFGKRYKGASASQYFEGRFDQLILSANWGETHGIIVGPEFSRIFAEIVLQSVDVALQSLESTRRREVVIKRYVDDYYLFSSDKAALDSTQDVVVAELRKINLFLNESKTETVVRPFVSPISASRARVAELVDDLFDRTLASVTGDDVLGLSPESVERRCQSTIHKIRRAATELEVSYAQISSFALSVLSRKVAESIETKVFREAEETLAEGASAAFLLAWFLSILRIGQFLYDTDRRVTTSIKLGRLYLQVARAASKNGCALSPLKGRMLDAVRSNDPTRADKDLEAISRINLLVAAESAIRSDPKLSPSELLRCIGSEDFEAMTYFELMAVLFISRRKSKFSKVRGGVVAAIKRKLLDPAVRFLEETEMALMLTDFLSCPHVDEKDKIDVVMSTHAAITGNGCKEATARKIVEVAADYSFVDWKMAGKLSSLLARKELTAAYD